MRTPSLKLAMVFAVSGALTACDKDDPVYCTAIFAYGLAVDVKDSVTNNPLSEGVAVTAHEGSYSETMQSVTNGHFFGAGERAGTYTVRVAKSGYVTWERTGIVVTADECHVHGVSMTAKLQANQ